jgi:hypothetical protein
VFPIIWLLGAFDLVNPDIELYAYLTIDVSVKVVFSVFLRQITLSSIEHREVQEYEKFKVSPPPPPPPLAVCLPYHAFSTIGHDHHRICIAIIILYLSNI